MESNLYLFLILVAVAMLAIYVAFMTFRSLRLELTGKDGFMIAIVFFVMGLMTEGLAVGDGRALILGVLVIVVFLIWTVLKVMSLKKVVA